MKVDIEFTLDDKQIYGYKILALSNIHVCPERVGFGTMLMKGLFKYADDNGYDFLIGFTADDVLDFYIKCGCFIDDRKYKYGSEDRNMFSNRYTPRNLVISETW